MAGFDDGEDDDIPDRHYGKPYNRELHNQLAGIMKLKQAAVDEDLKYAKKHRTGANPLSDRFKDLRKYLYQHQPQANTDTALVACSHATRPDQCMRARSSMMMASPTFGLTLNQRLRALGRTPSLATGSMARPSLVTFLAKRLARKISRNSRNIDDSGSHMQVSKYATDIQKKRSPDKGGRKSRTHKSRKNRSRKSRKNRNI